MLRRRVYEYTQVGYLADWLRTAKSGRDLRSIIEQLEKLPETMATLGLPVTSRMFQLESVGGLIKEFKEAYADDEDGQLTGSQANRLTAAMDLVQSTLIAEASGVYAYVVTEKRFATETLMGEMHKLLAKGVFEALPEIARRDFDEAGRAIAYEMPTAAVFHLMRALEAVLRDVYCEFIRQNRLKEPRMWSPMIEQMRKKKSNVPPQPLLDHFDHIRLHFRNPTQHPDAVYDLDVAQDLLSLACDAVNRALAAIKARK